MASIVGLKYITPLFELAREKGIVEEIEGNIKDFALLLRESKELDAVFMNPRIPASSKKGIVLKIAGDRFNALFRDFLCLLVDRGREQVFEFLESEFLKLLRESRNILSATVQSPVALADDFKRELAARFAERTGKTVELAEEVKPELIAGIRVLVGSSMLDGSLKARLEGIKFHLKQKTSTKTG